MTGVRNPAPQQLGGKGRGFFARLPGGSMKGLSLEALSPGNA